MQGTHCHRCGGSLGYRKRLSYRLPSDTTVKVAPHDGACSCAVAILDGPPPGFASLPAMPRVAPVPGSSVSRGQYRKK